MMTRSHRSEDIYASFHAVPDWRAEAGRVGTLLNLQIIRLSTTGPPWEWWMCGSWGTCGPGQVAPGHRHALRRSVVAPRALHSAVDCTAGERGADLWSVDWALGLGMEKGKVFAMNFFNSISICSKLLHGPNCISKTWLKKTSYTEESNDVNCLQRVTSFAWVLYLTRHHSASPSLPQIMAWRLGDKPLSEPMVVWRYVAKSPYTHHSYLVAFGPGHRQTLERCD